MGVCHRLVCRVKLTALPAKCPVIYCRSRRRKRGTPQAMTSRTARQNERRGERIARIVTVEIRPHQLGDLRSCEVRSAIARVGQLSPDSDRSVAGESTTLPTIACRAEEQLEFRNARRPRARVPQAESPVTAIFLKPLSMSPKQDARTSTSAAGKGCSGASL
jgi:hypothetical protein